MPGHFGGSTNQSPAGGASAGGNYGGNSSGGVSANNMSGAGAAQNNFSGVPRGTEQISPGTPVDYSPVSTIDARETYISQQYPSLTTSEIEKGITNQGEIINEKIEKDSLIERAFDLYLESGLIPQAFELGGSLLEGLGNFSKNLQNKAISFDLQNKLQRAYQSPTFDPFSPDSYVTQLEQDLKSAQAGEFSQQEYQDKYAPQMNNMGGDRGGDAERQLLNTLTPYAPYAISDTTPQESMVQNYFANLGMGDQSSISFNLEKDYNNAKQNINSLLGIVPPSQQFGYSSTPYGGLMGINLDYLRTQGLI